jgi:dihydrofolate reductase
MREIVTTHFVSLDGVAEAPGGEPGFRHSGWVFGFSEDAEAFANKDREQEEAGAMLMGGRTYEAFSAAWPSIDDFARWNSLPKYVVSRTVTDPQWHDTTVISFDAVARLKEGDGGPIYVQGSMALTQSLLRAGLVDEVRLMVFPVILGSGRGPFPTDAEDRLPLRLASSTTYDNGAQYQVFRTVA